VTRRYHLSLSAEDWVLIGYIAGILVWFFADTLTSSPPTTSDSSRTWTEQSVELSEDHLQRLEDGDSVKVHRWHGHDLVIGGGMVNDADQLGVEEDD
jgi:hypothetical protein